MAGRDGGDYGWQPGSQGQELPGAHAQEAYALMQARSRAGYERQAVAAPGQAAFRPAENPDGTITYQYRDGSIRFDPRSRPPRLLEFVNSQGEKTSFKYHGNSSQPDEFTVTDRDNHLKASGHKGAHDAEWKVKRERNGQQVEDRDAHIVSVQLTGGGQLDFVDKAGNHHEHWRTGNELTRDPKGRILAERTPGNRVTEYSYQGDGEQPSAFTVKDSRGNIVEHGVTTDGKKWTVYKPGPGEASLDPGKLEDPARAVRDPIDGVSGVFLRQADGMRVETHNNGDRTWQDDASSFRLNRSGALEKVHHTADGRRELVSYRDSTGVTTSYRYDRDGEVVGQTRAYPGGRSVTLTRDGHTDNWHTADGRTLKCHPAVLADGSVEMTYPDKGLILTQSALGPEVVRHIDADGQARVIHTTDTLGREIQYNWDNGQLVGFTVSAVINQAGRAPYRDSMQWTLKGDRNGEELWTSSRGGQFVGHHRFAADGSLVRVAANTGKQTEASLRGVMLELPAR